MFTALPRASARHGETVARFFVAAELMERRLLLASTAFTPVAAADFDADGASDTLVRVSVGRSRLAKLGFEGSAFRRGDLVILDDSGFLVGDPLGVRLRGNRSPLAAVADFNSDDTLDLVLAGRRLGGGLGSLAFFAGNGDGTFAAGVPIADSPSNVTSLAAADVDGDGNADLIGTTLVRNSVSRNLVGDRAVPADFEGDEGGEKLWALVNGDSNGGINRPHLVGATAEAGGGVVTGSTLLPSGTQSGGLFGDSLFGGFNFGGFDASLPPGFTPPASEVGVSAEAGGARVGGPDVLGNTREEIFVLFGDGAGGFSASSGDTATD